VKRRLSDIVFRRMLEDAITHMVTGPGGQWGTTTDSSGTGSHPNTGTSDKPLAGPANLQATPATTRGPDLLRSVPAALSRPTRSRGQAQFA